MLQHAIYNSNAASSSYETLLLCTLQSGILSCVGTDNWSKTTFLPLLWDPLVFELSGNHNNPFFPPLYPIKWWKFFVFLLLLQSMRPVHLWEECLGAHCNPNCHNSRQFHVKPLHAQSPNLWDCFLLDGKTSFLDLSHRWKLPTRYYRFCLLAQDLKRLKKYCFKSSHKWKRQNNELYLTPKEQSGHVTKQTWIWSSFKIVTVKLGRLPVCDCTNPE